MQHPFIGGALSRQNFTAVTHSRFEVVIAANHFLGESKPHKLEEL